MVAPRVLLWLLTLIALVGCGHVVAHPDTQPSAYAQPLSVPWAIATVSRTPDPRVVLLTLEPLPAADAPGVCRATVAYDLNEQPLSVGIGVTELSRVPPPFAGCALGARSLLARLRQPLGRRDVFASGAVTQQGGRFIASGTMYVECHPPGCDPMHQPMIASCSNLREAIRTTDVPTHFGMAGPCKGSFAAIVVDIGAGACPATGDGTNPCAGQRLTRQFWHINAGLWTLLAVGDKATCQSAQAVLRSFPLQLCGDAEWRQAVAGHA